MKIKCVLGLLGMVTEEICMTEINFLDATAQQIALCHGRDEPSEADIASALVCLERWNQIRMSLSLPVWE